MKSFTWISEFSQPLIADAGPLAAVIALATLAYAVARWWLVAGVRRLVRRSQAERSFSWARVSV